MTPGELDERISDRLRELEIMDARRERDIARLDKNLDRMERLQADFAPVASAVIELTLKFAQFDRTWDDDVRARNETAKQRNSLRTALIAVAIAAFLSPVAAVIVAMLLNHPKTP